MTSVLVVGDVLLDRDVIGRTTRLCPDAPVPVVDEDRVVDRAGGAGLAATLAARSGAEVSLLSAIAPDAGGRVLRTLVEADGVRLLDLGTGGVTCEKVRIRCGGQSLLRLDRGLGPTFGDTGMDGGCLVGVDAVLVADYGHGAASHPPVRALLSTARRNGVPVVWDPHPRGAPPVPGCTVVTPNRAESWDLDPALDTDDELTGLGAEIGRARRLRRHWEAGAVAVTLGESGALLVTGDGAPLVVPVDRPVEGADPCGAGDAFAAAVTVSLGRGAVVSEAVEAGVDAARRFVAEGGVSSWEHRRTLVATGGCFDLLHAGHVATLEAARALGDRLVVLLNSDTSVRRLKGPTRPVQGQDDRATVLRSLGCVDEVVIFEEDTPEVALRRLRPDVFVKGGDYAATELPESHVMSEWGGTVVTVPFLAGRSTTELIHRIDDTGATHVG